MFWVFFLFDPHISHTDQTLLLLPLQCWTAPFWRDEHWALRLWCWQSGQRPWHAQLFDVPSAPHTWHLSKWTMLVGKMTHRESKKDAGYVITMNTFWKTWKHGLMFAWGRLRQPAKSDISAWRSSRRLAKFSLLANHIVAVEGVKMLGLEYHYPQVLWFRHFFITGKAYYIDFISVQYSRL